MKQLVKPPAGILKFLLCGCLSLSVVPAAQPGPPPDRDGRFERLIAEIGLDAATQAQVSAIVKASKSEHRQLRRQLREAHDRMHVLLEQAEPDQEAVMAQANTIGALQTEKQKQRLRTVLQIRALLTPEQRRKLRELLRARGPHGHHRRHFSEDHLPCPPSAPPEP